MKLMHLRRSTLLLSFMLVAQLPAQARALEEVLSPEIAQEFRQLSTGEASPTLQQEVNALAQELSVEPLVAILTPSSYALDMIPLAAYVVAFPPFKVLMVNEQWLAQLTSGERRYALAEVLMIMSPHFKTQVAQALRTRKIMGLALDGAAIAALYGIDCYVKNEYHFTKWQRIATGVVAFMGLGIIELMVDKMYDKAAGLKRLLFVIKKLDCLDDALAVYKKKRDDLLLKRDDSSQLNSLYTFYNDQLIPYLEKLKAA